MPLEYHFHKLGNMDSQGMKVETHLPYIQWLSVAVRFSVRRPWKSKHRHVRLLNLVTNCKLPADACASWEGKPWHCAKSCKNWKSTTRTFLKWSLAAHQTRAARSLARSLWSWRMVSPSTFFVALLAGASARPTIRRLDGWDLSLCLLCLPRASFKLLHRFYLFACSRVCVYFVAFSPYST